MKNKPKPFKRLCLRCEKLFQPTGKYQKICEKCNKQTKYLRKLESLLIRTKTEEVICVNCHNSFRRWKKAKKGKKTLLPNVKRVNRITCSKKCAKEWDIKRKKMEYRNRRYKNIIIEEKDLLLYKKGKKDLNSLII